MTGRALVVTLIVIGMALHAATVERLRGEVTALRNDVQALTTITAAYGTADHD